MRDDRITAVLYIHEKNTKTDVEIPLNITANELIIGLNRGFDLGMDTTDLSECYLKTENPIAFLRGNKIISDYNLRNGTIIHFT